MAQYARSIEFIVVLRGGYSTWERGVHEGTGGWKSLQWGPEAKRQWGIWETKPVIFCKQYNNDVLWRKAKTIFCQLSIIDGSFIYSDGRREGASTEPNEPLIRHWYLRNKQNTATNHNEPYRSRRTDILHCEVCYRFFIFIKGQRQPCMLRKVTTSNGTNISGVTINVTLAIWNRSKSHYSEKARMCLHTNLNAYVTYII